MFSLRNIFVLLFIQIPFIFYAKVVLPSFFTDNMVLQRASEISLYGKARSGGDIKIMTSWNGDVYFGKVSNEGTWRICINTPKAGGPFYISISDGEELVLRNILIGDVWFCSGQSNMEMPVEGWGKVLDYQEEVKAANFPYIRLLQVKHTYSLYPKDDVDVDFGWVECNPSTIQNFSSTAYFFARKLWNELKIPIGLIHSSWGGTPAEAWTSNDMLANLKHYEREAEKLSLMQKNKVSIEESLRKEYYEWFDLLKNKDKGFVGDSAVWAQQEYEDSDWSMIPVPALWEKNGFSKFDGIAWYRKNIEIPSSWFGKNVTLSLGFIDDNDILYFNGVEIGRTYGCATQRMYTIPSNLIYKNNNIISVRVIDNGGDGGILGDTNNLFISCNDEKIPLSGLWKFKVGLDFSLNKEMLEAKPIDFQYRPSYLYNAMVNPFINYLIKGFIWYQGESNEGKAMHYSDLFKALINDWRNKWKDMDLPFYFVQLSSYRNLKKFDKDSKWALIREAQSDALRLNNTGMAVTIDIGEANDIHPKNKQEVGYRLALLALDNTYGYSDIESSSQVYSDYEIRENKIILSFRNLGKGFKTEKELKGFVIAGMDHEFHDAEAVIIGDRIIVSSSKVKYPVAVRYAWADNPICNLFGKNGLPVSPFRTDSW